MEKSHLQCVSWPKHRDRLKEPITRIGNIANDPHLYQKIDKACSNERAFLFLIPDGFFVLWPRYINRVPYIEVTVASCHGGNAMIRYQHHIKRLAEKGNASFIEFLTARKGFDKLAPKHGWRRFGAHNGLSVWRYFIRGE
ncbi:hypothetical protein [uncultured Paraglaciecola sp.]|uniref:hypothetical protein n=1 Tax=uncultured Paraglaciecola sp. TaxID=1765024 RepID=UPI00262A095B|nr:hypothetical protein [uncultured Paraglaciecola sp.]